METLWFCLVAFMITGYVILDGYDLGAGFVHLFAAKTKDDRALVLKSIGPFWDGNEVWLLAGGGTLFFAFPGLYASSFSGFYLPLMIVLWLLMLRGISIELRNHVESPIWHPFWDLTFGIASALLAVFYGAALGNVVRGVPLNRDGEFFLPLWTHWGVHGNVGILDWYTVLTGVFALSALAMHGSLWVWWKTTGVLQGRVRALAFRAAIVTAALTLLVSLVTFSVQPKIAQSFAERPWGAIFPLIALSGLAAIFLSLRRENEPRAFMASCIYLLGMMTSVVFGVFPMVLPSNADPRMSLTIYNTAAAHYGLRIGLMWWVPGMILAGIYSLILHRRFAGKVG